MGVWRNWFTRTTQNRMRKLMWVRVPPRPQMSAKKKICKDYLWTPNVAYAVGLITTDGCLSSDGRHIIMRSSEIGQLENFKKCLDIGNKIEKTEYKGVISHRVQCGDVSLYKWLLKIGLTPKKSKTIGEILVPDKYFRDFLRGHLDGDGSITSYTDYYNTKKNLKYIYRRFFVCLISASYKHIEWLHKKILKNLDVEGRIHVRISKIENRANINIIKFMKKNSIKLLEKVYYSSKLPTLTRKREVYENFIKQSVHEKD